MNSIQIQADPGTSVSVNGTPVWPPPAPPQPGLAVGYNVTTGSYYDVATIFANVLRDAAYTGTVNAAGRPKAGVSGNYVIYSDNRFLWAQHKPGTYVVKGTGTGAALSIGGAAVSGRALGTPAVGQPFRYTFTVNPMAAPATLTQYRPASQFTLSISASGVADMVDLVCCHADDEATIDAGGWFSVDAIRDYQTASKGPLRMMQWQLVASGLSAYIGDPGDIPADDVLAIPTAFGTVSSTNGAKGTVRNVHAPSPEMLGRFATACGMPLWVNAHPQMSDATLAAWFGRIATTYPAGQIVVELGNEPWNSAYWNINSGYLGLLYPTAGQPGAGAGLTASTAQSSVNASLGHASLRAWKAAEAVFGTARVRRVMNVQLVWVDNSISSLDYVDPGIIQAGKKVGELMHTATVATYLGLTPDKWQQGPGSSRGVVAPGYGLGISKRWLVQNQVTADALFCEKAWRNSVDQTLYFKSLWDSALAARGYPKITAEYEGHQPEDSFTAGYVAHENKANGDNVTPAGDSSICVRYTAADGSMVPANGTVNGMAFSDAGANLADWFADGEIACVTWSGAPKDSAYQAVRLIGGKLYLFATDAAYAAGLGSQITGGADGAVFLVCNTTRTGAWSKFLCELWWSNPAKIDGKSILDYMHDAYKNAGGFTIAAAFKVTGSAMHASYTGAGYPARVATSANKPHSHGAPWTPVMTRHAQLT